LERTVVPGAAFVHLIYARNSPSLPAPNTVVVYIEGDGTPRTRDGTRPASDPTPRQPLSLDLMLRTTGPAWYLTRPCYNGMNQTPGCSAVVWTNARYSTAVVDSMTAALQRYAQSHGAPRIVLVGHSGGGTLAVLMAPRVANLVGVITIAANLDTDAWAEIHGYLPLADSLNPARQAAHDNIQEIDLVGERDTKVPTATLQRYFAQHPQARVWRYENFDHVCCWVDKWPGLLDSALVEFSNSGR
jgi:predicted alpha/beta hydrolase family esterase